MNADDVGDEVMEMADQMPRPSEIVVRIERDADGEFAVTEVRPERVLRLPEEITVTNAAGEVVKGRLMTGG